MFSRVTPLKPPPRTLLKIPAPATYKHTDIHGTTGYRALETLGKTGYAALRRRPSEDKGIKNSGAIGKRGLSRERKDVGMGALTDERTTANQPRFNQTKRVARIVITKSLTASGNFTRTARSNIGKSQGDTCSSTKTSNPSPRGDCQPAHSKKARRDGATCRKRKCRGFQRNQRTFSRRTDTAAYTPAQNFSPQLLTHAVRIRENRR